MKNIEFKISKHSLIVDILKKDLTKVNINNTNIIDIKETYFSIDHIEANLELVASFLNVIILKKAVNKIIIKDDNIIEIIIKLINLIPQIEELVIKPDKIMKYSAFMLLLENKYLKKIDVFDIPNYLLERLDINKDLTINIRSEILFISNFMSENNFNSYSDLYYAKTINISHEFKFEDYQDFETFMCINNYLKTININFYTADIFDLIIGSVKEHNKTNIKIIIKEEGNNLKEIYPTINKVKKKYERYFRNNNITFKMNYSKEFKRDNMFKQLNLNFIKICAQAVIILLIILIGINVYKSYSLAQDIRSIENDLQDILNQIHSEYNFEDQEMDIEIIGPGNTPITTRWRPPAHYVSSFYRNQGKVFETLLKINSHTVGWLTVNNTKIDYPVVQAKDNKFYLNRDFKRQRNSMGWIFMDYRNRIDVLNANTIIYGHNVHSNLMFGSLRYTLNRAWYTNEKNQIITFNTPHANMKWQIFSIYRSSNTTDYLTTRFSTDRNHQRFINMITRRSIHNFKQTVTPNDKILTLSTCHGIRGAERLVVHAKLITE